MLTNASICNFRRSFHSVRYQHWWHRNQQHSFLWSDALLFPTCTRSQTMLKSHYSRARKKALCFHMYGSSHILLKEVNNPMHQNSLCCLHVASCLDTQSKIRIKPSKEVIDKDELEADHRIVVDNDPRKHCQVLQDSRISSKTDLPPSSSSLSGNIVNSHNLSTSSGQSVEPSQESPVVSVNKENGRAVESSQIQSRVQRYFLWRYSWYLKKFQDSLKQEMPDTYKMFHIFTVGMKQFVIDFKDLIKVLVVLSLPGKSLRSLSHHELLLYYYMPGDMVRVFPVLLLSSVPFGQNVAFPVGYWFPRHLLCRHFWDIQQQHEFSVISLKKRLFNARPVFRSLQVALTTIKDEEQQEMCRQVFFKLGSGIHPTTQEIISLIPLFQGDPFHIRQIWVNHVNGLLRLHGRSVWGLRRRRLEDHARLLHCMDAALVSQGLASLSHDNLKTCLFLRGVNPTKMSTAEMMSFMEDWLQVSQAVDTSSYSLLLHLPILLGYNQPSNIFLIY